MHGVLGPAVVTGSRVIAVGLLLAIATTSCGRFEDDDEWIGEDIGAHARQTCEDVTGKPPVIGRQLYERAWRTLVPALTGDCGRDIYRCPDRATDPYDEFNAALDDLCPGRLPPVSAFDRPLYPAEMVQVNPDHWCNGVAVAPGKGSVFPHSPNSDSGAPHFLRPAQAGRRRVTLESQQRRSPRQWSLWRRLAVPTTSSRHLPIA